MNNSNKRWKLSVVLLTLLVITSCGMTPAEKQAQRYVIVKQQKLQSEAKAKSIYSMLNYNFVWQKNTIIPELNKQFNYQRFGKKNIEFNDDFLWEKVAIKRTWHDAKNNCESATVAGLTNWRLPNVEEARKLNWGPIPNPYGGNHLTSFWTSNKTTDIGSGLLPNSMIWLNEKQQKRGDLVYVWYRSDYKYAGKIRAYLPNSHSYRAATRCIHNRNSSFREFSLYETAQAIFELKKPSEQKLKTELPKSIKHKLKTFIQPNIGEFETTEEYHKRFSKLHKDINAHNDKLKTDYDRAYKKAVLEREKEFALMNSKYESQKPQYKVDSFKEAFFVMYGNPILKNVLYNADLQAFTMNVTSEYGNFNQQLKIPLSVKYAPKFKKLITAKSFSPTVELDIRNGEIFVTGIKEIADPALIVERDEYNKAKSSITKLNAFIKKYPNSALVVTARKQISKLQHIAEQKRLAAIELAKDDADGEIIGTKNLEGAKFLAGRIWQDQAVNNNRTYNFEEAEKYCKNYRGLGASGWRLPSENDFESLKGNVAALAYRPTHSQKFTGHFSRDENCIDKGWGAVSKEECVVAADLSSDKEPHIIKTSKSWKLYPRCVLSAYKYNQHAKNQEAKYLSVHTLDGYINAFMTAGNDVNIKKAFELAETNDELAKVEMALIKYFGLHDVFSLKGSLVTKDDSEANRGEIDASLLLNMISSSGNAEFKYEVFPNANSTVPLKYGKYKVRLKVKLAMNYINTMKKALFGLDLSTSETEIKEREFEVILSPDNGWKASGNVDFGTIMQGTKGAVFVFKMETKLRNIKPRFDLLSIEKM